jgi:hypothetical protein
LTCRAPLLEPAPGKASFQVSALAAGSSEPLRSPPVTVDVVATSDAEVFLEHLASLLRSGDSIAFDGLSLSKRVTVAIRAAGQPALDALADMIAGRSLRRSTADYRQYAGPYPDENGNLGETTFVITRQAGSSWKLISF